LKRLQSLKVGKGAGGKVVKGFGKTVNKRNGKKSENPGTTREWDCPVQQGRPKTHLLKTAEIEKERLAVRLNLPEKGESVLLMLCRGKTETIMELHSRLVLRGYKTPQKNAGRKLGTIKLKTHLETKVISQAGRTNEKKRNLERGDHRVWQ